MRKKRNWKLVAGLLMLAVLTVSVLAGCGQGKTYATQKNYITIGCVLPLSGELAPYGEGSLETEEAAVAEINENDGVYIDTLQRKLKIRFVVADSASTAEGAAQAVKKLVEEDNADVLISTGGTLTSVAAAKACEELKVPFFSVGADPDFWKAAGPFRYCFNCDSSNEARIEALSDLWNQYGITSIGFMAEASYEADAFGKALSAFCSANGYTLTDTGLLDPTSPNYSDAVQKLSDGSVEVLICYMSGENFSRAWQQGDIRGLGLEMCILESDPLFAGDIAGVAPGTDIQEFYTVTDWDRKYPFTSSLTDETGTDLANWWEGLFLSNASEQLAHKHVCTEIAVGAIKLAMALDADSICSAARSLDIDTLMGLVDFDENGLSTYPCSVLRWSFDVPTVSWTRELASHSRLTDVEFDEE